MQYFLFGLAALGLGLLLLQGFTRADVAILARQIRVFTGTLALGGAVALVIRGMMSYALPLAMFGSWLLWGRGGVPPWGGSAGRPHKSTGQTSRVVTDYLEMELDHDTGAMRGRVLKGRFGGRELESMAPAEMVLLWQECRFADPQSAQLIEAYLDRAHPAWREDMARGRAEPGPNGMMTPEEAYEVLGVPPGASEEEIRRAHRDLMLKLHPDRGGSSYLAAKINQAKDVLLGRSRH
jgi:hypothetical protein